MKKIIIGMVLVCLLGGMAKAIHYTGNIYTYSFYKAKKNLEKKVYNGEVLPRSTFYCGCNFSEKKIVDPSICGFSNNGKYKKRSKKVEWEHVVPASTFGKTFDEWKNGRSRMKNREYLYMQSDMYNLVPSIGSVNAIRRNYNFASILGEKREFGSCDFEVSNQKVEVSEDLRGDIARIYMYMSETYPNRGIMVSDEMYDWNDTDPVSSEECARYEAIKGIQRNENIILKEKCFYN